MADECKGDQKKLVEWFRLFDQVKRWIEGLLKVVLSSDPVRFVEGLQDGVVLCYLCRAIDERSIPRVQENSTDTLSCRINLTFFFGACKDFGLPPNRIFSMADLTSKKVVRVVDTLVAIARRVVLPPPEGVGFGTPLPESDEQLDITSITALCPKESLDSVAKDVSTRRRLVRKKGGLFSPLVACSQLKQITEEGSCLFHRVILRVRCVFNLLFLCWFKCRSSIREGDDTASSTLEGSSTAHCLP